MLESFEISNFRLFQHLKVERLNRVNLIVGKNNSGKSTFLEAIQLYASNASPDVILDLVDSRQETWFSEAQPKSQNLIGNFVRHLFFKHKLPKINEQGILLGEVSSNTKLNIGVAAYQIKISEDIIRETRIEGYQLSLFDEDEDFSDLSNTQVFLVVEEGEKTKRLFRLDRNLTNIRLARSTVLYNESQSTWQIVSTENMPSYKLASLWDLTSVTHLGTEVISALKLIDNRVSGVTFVDNIYQKSSDGNRIPLVKIEGIDDLLPLKSMGDGMTRLFHIIVALVNAKNGILLIDEFENGLHWTVQPKVWDMVFQLSEKLNVQVFATTHSRDCIEGFDSAWNKYPDLGAFFRLDIKDGLIKATEYTSETLTDAIDMDVEVR